MIDLILLAIVSFVSVFVLGFQSRNINSGQYVAAAVCSIFIGLTNAYVWKAVTKADTFIEIMVYSVAGGMGIVSAMFVHQRYLGGKKRG